MAQARFYALSLHGALPILEARGQREDRRRAEERERLKDGEDEAAQDRRQDHGKRYGQRDADAARAQDRRGFLEIGGDELERVGEHDEHVREGVDLGGRRILKKKKEKRTGVRG